MCGKINHKYLGIHLVTRVTKQLAFLTISKFFFLIGYFIKKGAAYKSPSVNQANIPTADRQTG